MCFHSQISITAKQLQNRFNAKFENGVSFNPSVYNGFQHPKTPIITNKSIETISLYNWGLIPHWAKDNSIQKYTLNAKIETLTEKPSFRDVVNNRCLILTDGFYEWQWLDEKGKKKQKYLITMPNKEAFAFAGLYSEWLDKSTGELLNTYTVMTMQANELMSKIHNSTKRMPVILDKSIEMDWLNGNTNTIIDLELLANKV